MKKVKIVLCALFVLTVLVPITKISAATPDYDYQFIDQSGYPTIKPGESAIIWIKVKNTGTKSWIYEQGRLGTSNPKDRASIFMPDPANSPELENKRTNWVSSNRIKMDKNTTLPGETVGFGFYIKAPANLSPGVYREHFRPVIDGADWMKDIGIYWDIKVVGNNEPTSTTPTTTTPTTTKPETTGTYDYQIVNQSTISGTVKQGGVIDAWVDLKNTGTATWKNSGPNPFRLASGSKYSNETPVDSPSMFFAPTEWIAMNRAATFSNSEVKPGETARISFKLKVPEFFNTGDYKAYFTPVVEGVKWLNDIGIYWPIKVLRDIPPETIIPNAFEYELSSQNPSSPISMSLGEIKEVSIKIKNIGSASWFKEGEDSVILGWGSKYDAINQVKGFASGVQASLLQNEVKPGEVGEFKFQIKAPSTAGAYKFYFTPMVQGIYPQPFKDIGIYWAINVGNSKPSPMTPSNLKVEKCVSQTDRLCLSWSSEVRDGVASTDEVYRSTDPNTGFNLVATVNSGGYQDSSVSRGVTYYYKIRSRFINTDYSAYSSVVSGSLSYSIPSAPTNLKAERCMTRLLCITWSSPVRDGVPTTDQLYRSNNQWSGFALIYSGNINGYQDSNLVDGTNYYYKVRSSYDGINFSDYSTVVVGGIPLANEVALSEPPTITKVESTGINTMNILWTPPTTAYNYMELYYSLGQDWYYTLLWTGSGTSIVHMGLEPGKTYYYKMRAVNAAGAGIFSSIVSGTTKTIAGDMNNDGVINDSDLTTMYSMYNGSLVATDAADLNGDGQKAKIADLNEMVRIYKSQTGYRQGDINKDGLVNNSDLTLLSQMISGSYPMTIVNIVRGDMNGNLSITLDDLSLLEAIV